MTIGSRFAALLSLFVFAVAGLAQQAASASQPTTRKISLDVVVTPKGGAPVAGLTQQDFTVLDNKTQQTITSFRALGGSHAPVGVIIVIDAVNTEYQNVAVEREQIGKFLRANGGHLAYPTTLAILSDQGIQIQNGFSRDGNVLGDALDQFVVSLRAIRRSAGFYGASERLQLSVNAMRQLGEHAASLPGRKFVLWLSPGWPILSGPAVQVTAKDQQNIFDTIVNLSTGLRQARVTLYSIDPLGTTDAASFRTFYYETFLKGVRNPDQTQFGNLALQVLATQTGGLVLNSSNDVTGLLQRAVADASAYYELSFDPAPSEPGEYHQLEVKVAKPGLVARTRTGYYSSR